MESKRRLVHANEVGEVVVHPLVGGQVFREMADNTGCDGDVAKLDGNAAGLGEAVDDGEELKKHK
jgi:hypothetical protein